MLIRAKENVSGTARDVDWGNGTSLRLLVDSDGLGYTVTETYVKPGSSSLLRYDNHAEACYCVEGSGTVKTADGVFEIKPGVLYAPARGEEHLLSSDTGMTLICVFNPALNGRERHDIRVGDPSSY